MGVKLFLKGDKCFSPKCPLVRKPYPPGQRKKRRTRGLSEYGKELKEKQKLRNWYNLREKQFQNYVRSVLNTRSKTEDTETLLIRLLESRLDNVIFRLGFATSRTQARQLISHGHFLINEKPINIPSYSVKKGDKVNLKPSSLNKAAFKSIQTKIKKIKPPSWLELNAENLEAKVTGLPSYEEASPPAEISSIFEFYSR